MIRITDSDLQHTLQHNTKEINIFHQPNKTTHQYFTATTIGKISQTQTILYLSNIHQIDLHDITSERIRFVQSPHIVTHSQLFDEIQQYYRMYEDCYMTLLYNDTAIFQPIERIYPKERFQQFQKRFQKHYIHSIPYFDVNVYKKGNTHHTRVYILHIPKPIYISAQYTERQKLSSKISMEIYEDSNTIFSYLEEYVQQEARKEDTTRIHITIPNESKGFTIYT